MKKYLPLFAAAVFAAALAFAGPITTWVTGDTVTASDLSANFTHLHATMVGGHGPRLVNADVNASAAIAHSKMATPALLPKAWVYATNCTGTSCTAADSSGVSAVSRQDAGIYTVTFSASRANDAYGSLVTAAWYADQPRLCHAGSSTTPSIQVFCVTLDGGYPADSSFTYMLLDSNN